jgi:ABC-type phosphate transport system permease subunit
VVYGLWGIFVLTALVRSPLEIWLVLNQAAFFDFWTLG